MNKNPEIKHMTEWYYEQALEIVRKQYPDTKREELTKQFGIGYMNDDEYFIDYDGTVEYPGIVMPSFLRITEQEFIDRIVTESIRIIESAKNNG